MADQNGWNHPEVNNTGPEVDYLGIFKSILSKREGSQ